METFGYKFSDTTVLNYKCIIELCKRATNECQGLSPPICSRHKRDLKNDNLKLKENQNRTLRYINESMANQVFLFVKFF